MVDSLPRRLGCASECSSLLVSEIAADSGRGGGSEIISLGVVEGVGDEGHYDIVTLLIEFEDELDAVDVI